MLGSDAAPSTMLRMVPLPRFAGEEPETPTLPILPRLRGRGTAEGGGGGGFAADLSLKSDAATP